MSLNPLTYEVGNSLTEDAGGAAAQRQLPMAHGYDGQWRTSYHIARGKDLTFIAANPGTFDAVSPAAWNQTLNRYTFFDTLCLQPHPGDTIASEETAFQTIANFARGSANPTVRLFVYETWPTVSSFNPSYQSYWEANFVPTGASQFTQQLACYQRFYNDMATVYGKVSAIPAGSVFNQIDILARAGKIPGVASVADFYRDDVHMGDAGQFVANCTYFASHYRLAPNASPFLIGLYTGGAGPVLTLALAQQLQQIVWGVVSADTRVINP